LAPPRILQQPVALTGRSTSDLGTIRRSCWRVPCGYIPANESARGTIRRGRPALGWTHVASAYGSNRRLFLDLSARPDMYFGDGQVHELPYFVVWQWNSREIAVSSVPKPLLRCPIRARTFRHFRAGSGGQEPRRLDFEQRGEWREVLRLWPLQHSRALWASPFIRAACAQTPGIDACAHGRSGLLLGLGEDGSYLNEPSARSGR